ncbi:uncharacterized protein LOC143288794 [Babylonia areolata]|uniref:uncharacterized protein LOC143288794 n=1 Tax=Babylonia areolata TaxID=304850 RepID=UPI003FD14320
MAENGEYTPSPRPHPRLRPEGAAYAERNRGTMERWFDYSDNVDNYNSPRPGERLRSDTARKIAETNKGVMDEMMGGYPDPPQQAAVHPRAVKGEAAQIAESNKGGPMRDLMENYGNMSLSNNNNNNNNSVPAHKVIGEEATEYAERNHGKMDHIINNYGVVTPPERPAPKVSYGGQDNLEKAQGADMGPLMRMEGAKSPREVKQGKLHQESQGGGWDEMPPAHRMRPEGESIAIKNSSDSMFDLMRSDGNASVSQPSPPVKENRRLPHMEESPSPRQPANPPRTRPEGMRNYEKAHNQSEMAAILRGEGDQRPSTPARNVRHLQRSELW